MKAGQLVINRYLESMAITREIANHAKWLRGIGRCKPMQVGCGRAAVRIMTDRKILSVFAYPAGQSDAATRKEMTGLEMRPFWGGEDRMLRCAIWYP